MDCKVISEIAGRKVWQLWFGLACATTVVTLATLRISPPIWQDEVQIVDYGRTAIQGSDRSWSINWSSEGRPMLILSYLACGLQELACCLTGNTEVGPRLASVVGALFAGTCALGWLLQRGCVPIAALGGAVLLLVDPVFAQSYRGARVDCWVFGFIFLTCWLIQRSTVDSRREKRVNLLLILAGVPFALAGLCWPSAILLVPLVLSELMVAYQLRLTWNSFVGFIPGLVTLGAATTMALLLFLAPVWSSVWSAVMDLSGSVSNVSKTESILSSGYAIAASYRLSPWLLVLGIGGFFVQPNRLLGIAFLLAALGVSLTTVYIHRALYLLPYLLLSVVCLIALLAQAQRLLSIALKAGLLALACLVCWSSAVTLGARTWTAWSQRLARSPDRILEVGKAAIGARDVSVYTHCWEFYYAGRQLGWRQFRLFSLPEDQDSEVLSRLLSKMDFVILREGDPANRQIQHSMQQVGFTLSRRIQAGSQAGEDNRVSRSRLGASGFGEYLIYAPTHTPSVSDEQR